MSSVEVVERAYDAVRRRDLDELLRVFAPDCVFIDQTEGGSVQGHEAFTEYMKAGPRDQRSSSPSSGSCAVRAASSSAAFAGSR